MGKLFNKTLLIRTLSAVGILFIVLLCTLLSSYTLLLLLVAICIGGMQEFYSAARLSGAQPLSLLPVLIGVFSIGCSYAVGVQLLSPLFFLLLPPLVFVVFIVELYRKTDHPFSNIAWGMLGLLYIALPLALLMYLPFLHSGVERETAYHPWAILSILFVVWANDIGAYLFGVAFGRHRLMERISPKKSWEGFVGGVLCAIGMGVLLAYYQNVSMLVWAGGSLIIAVMGVYGDLIESMLKRSVNLKDSGHLIPGHGGFLDRFDALLVATPFIFVYLIIFT